MEAVTTLSIGLRIIIIWSGRQSVMQLMTFYGKQMFACCHYMTDARKGKYWLLKHFVSALVSESVSVKCTVEFRIFLLVCLFLKCFGMLQFSNMAADSESDNISNLPLQNFCVKQRN